MAANSAVVGILRALLTADTASFDTGMRKAESTLKLVEKATQKTATEISKLTPQAERMVKAFSGDKLLYSANNLVTAITKIGGATKLTDAEQARANRTLSDAIAKYAALGQTAPKAMVDLEHATRKVEQPTSFLTTKMIALGAAVGTFVSNLAFQGARALVGFARDAFDAASQITDLSDKTGLSTQTIQRMQFVANQTSTSLDAMTNAAFKLGVQIAGGGKSVKQGVEDLGLSFAAIQRMRPDQQFEAIVGALSKVENQQERNRIGVLLFGRQFSEIAAAVEQGYQDIAAGASLSSDAQLRALDRAGDRWAKFVANTKTNVTSFLGQIVLMSDAMREVDEEAQKRLHGPRVTTEFAAAERQARADERRVQLGLEDLAASRNAAEAVRRMQLGLVGGRREDIALSEAAAKAQATYTEKLADVREELSKLTQAQRREIDAAQQLGENTDDLETKFGLSTGTLKLLNAQTKDYEQNLKKILDKFSGSTLLKDAKEYEAALKAIGGAQKLTATEGEAFLSAFDAVIAKYRRLGPAGAAVVEHFTALRDQFKQTDAAALRHLENEKRAADASAIVLAARDATATAYLQGELLRLETVKAIDAAAITHLENEKRAAEAERVILATRDSIANEFLQSELRRLEALKGTKLEDPFSKWAEQGKQQRARAIEMWKGFGRQFEDATLGQLGTLAFGQFAHDIDGSLKAAADEAELDFLRIQRSGKATAEELSTAFTRWREAEDRANFDFGERMKAVWGGIKQTIIGVLNDVLSFFTKQFIGGLIKGLAGANLAQNIGNAITGGLTGAALGGGASAATGVSAAVAGTGAAAGGGGASLAAFATNPFTLAAIGGAVLGAFVWRKGLFRGGEEALNISPRRDQLFGQLQAMFGGSQYEAAVKAFDKAKVPGNVASALIGAVYRADDKKTYEPAQSAFVSALVAGGLKTVKGFNLGGFVPPGVVQPAMLHGGAFGEDIVPRTNALGSGSPVVNQHYTVNIHANALNADGMDAVFARDIVPRLQWEFRLNQRGTIDVLQKALAH